MAWEDTLLDASYKGIRFDIQAVSTSGGRDLARVGLPYQNGEQITDTGGRSKSFSVNAIFWGDDYEARLKAFLKAVDAGGPGEFIHPIYGPLAECHVQDWSEDHSTDLVDGCLLRLTLVLGGARQSLFERELPAAKAAGAANLADTARGLAVLNFANAFDFILSLRGSFARINAWKNTLLSVMTDARSLTGMTTNTVSQLISTPQDFTADLAGLLDGLVDLRWTSGSTGEFSALRNSFKEIVKLPAKSADTGAAADLINRPYPEDVAKTTAVVQALAATELATVTAGVLQDEAETATLSPPQIESMVNGVREELQATIDAYRELYPLEESMPAVEALKATAHNLLVAAIAVINSRPPLITREVEAAGNLHLIAHWWYGDSRRAAELARLNPQVRNPNFVSAGEVLNAYAR